MSLSSQPTADIEATGIEAAELEAIVTAIATSPIVVPPVEPRFALSDWERVRHSPDADGFILAWIASHVRPRNPVTLS